MSEITPELIEQLKQRFGEAINLEFVENPGAVAVVAGAFSMAFVFFTLLGRMYRRFRGRPFLAAAALWVLYAFWEWFCQGKGWNIRIDLLLIYPTLLAASIAACLLSYRWKQPPE